MFELRRMNAVDCMCKMTTSLEPLLDLLCDHTSAVTAAKLLSVQPSWSLCDHSMMYTVSTFLHDINRDVLSRPSEHTLPTCIQHHNL